MEVNCIPKPLPIAVPAGHAFHLLDLGVEAFGAGVGHSKDVCIQDADQVITDHLGDLDHGFESASRSLQDELSVLEEKLDAIFEKFGEEVEGLPESEQQVAADKIMSSEGMEQLLERLQDVQGQLAKVGAKPIRESGIWLYRRR